MSSFICSDPLSPSYSTLPRYNTLILLVFILVSSSNSWAVKGALAALMTRTATIAFHAIALLGATHFRTNISETVLANNLEVRTNTVDLDIIGAWVVLSATGAAIPLFLGAAAALKTSRARPLVKLWGILIITGAVCAFVGVRRSDRAALRLGVDEIGESGGIELRCRNATHTPLRSGPAIAIDATRVFGRIGRHTLTGKFDITVLVVMAFGIYACLKKKTIGSLDSGSKPIGNESFGGDWAVKSSPRRGTSTLGSLIRSLELLGLLITSTVLATIVVLHEMYMLKDGGIPMLEGLAAYEQWSCWAASGLVVLATIINWWIGKMEPTVSTTRLGGGGAYKIDHVNFPEPSPTCIC